MANCALTCKGFQQKMTYGNPFHILLAEASHVDELNFKGAEKYKWSLCPQVGEIILCPDDYHGE